VIAKRVPRRRDSRASFKALAAYLLDEAHGGAKAALVRVTHCLTEDPSLAVKEIEATQALNRRTKNDKTYHLVVSFRAGERPSEAQLRDIEREVCAAIGLGEHHTCFRKRKVIVRKAVPDRSASPVAADQGRARSRGGAILTREHHRRMRETVCVRPSRLPG
jgi:hypothetical protein